MSQVCPVLVATLFPGAEVLTVNHALYNIFGTHSEHSCPP